MITTLGMFILILHSTFALAVGPKLVEQGVSSNIGQASQGEAGVVKRKPVYVYCTKSSAQTLVHNVRATIDYNDCTGNTELVTTGSNWEFQAPNDGVYHISAAYFITGTGCDSLADNAYIGYKVNPVHGAEVEDARMSIHYCLTTNTATSISRAPAGSAIVRMNKGDTLAIKGLQTSNGTNQAINLANTLTFVSITEGL